MKDNTVSFQKFAKRSQNQKKILDAAEKVFAEAGFAGATTQLIADVANLPKANVHYYFKTKQDIYRQVVYNIFDIWMEAASAFDTELGPELHSYAGTFHGSAFLPQAEPTRRNNQEIVTILRRRLNP